MWYNRFSSLLACGVFKLDPEVMTKSETEPFGRGFWRSHARVDTNQPTDRDQHNQHQPAIKYTTANVDNGTSLTGLNTQWNEESFSMDQHGILGVYTVGGVELKWADRDSSGKPDEGKLSEKVERTKSAAKDVKATQKGGDA